MFILQTLEVEDLLGRVRSSQLNSFINKVSALTLFCYGQLRDHNQP